MRCFTARKQIDLLLDNELDARRSADLKLHLPKCPQCSAYLAQGEKLSQILTQSPDPEFPSWVHHQILDRVKIQENTRKTFRHRLELQAIPVSMAIVLSVYFGIQVGVKTFSSPDITTSETTETEYVVFGENSLIAYDTNGAY
ncbi:MAG: zf-HC2 domain-containing protein [Candidatus Cloacimonadaceae bacterium]|nr:zf-HC2 domain-containing protein [Candidatus Cloacimonadaceae bacterium]